MKFVLAFAVLAVAAALVSASQINSFDAWATAHGKEYSTEEYAHRQAVFQQNSELIEKLNGLDNGAQYELNKFADLTPDEFRTRFLAKTPMGPLPEGTPVHPDLAVEDNPTSYDWRDHGAVTAVKNQEQCGSCWSFSTTGNIEGQWFLSGKTLVGLSEQQFVDCDKVDQGCNGGLPSNAYQYAIQAGGVESEADYPYLAMDSTCKFSADKVVATISNWTQVSTDEDQIAAFLVKTGPLSIGINAEWMQFYAGGVSDPLFCDPKKLDHGVLIVGYGVDGSKPYWIIKNSWGPTWGEKGYYRIVRGKGKCGLNTMVTSAFV